MAAENNGVEPKPAAGDPTTTRTASAPPPKDTAFWLSILSLTVATFLAALDTSAVSTALPTMIADLQGKEFVWIGSAYSLAGTAFLPLSGHLANIFGRRPILLIFLLAFAVGSAICGAAQSMNMLIAGRTIQGMGSGGILALTEIVLADLVPLAERGSYQGMLGLTWSIASVIGPVVGGAFAQRKDWTWRGLFYMNLPLTGISAILCLFFLRLKVPHASFKERFGRIDWIGNIIIIGSTTSALIGLTWAGVRRPWDDPAVLAPFIIGLVGIVAFIAYEAKVPKEPTVPWRLLNNRTSLSGYIGTGLQGLIISAALFYLPVYFQACKLASPLRSGVDMLPYSFSIAPFAIVAGATATGTGKYRPQNVIAWVFIIIGMGLQSTLHTTSATRNWVGFQIVAGIGFGLLFTATTFPILAPLPTEDNAAALSVFIFVRSFFQAWGVTIGSTVLQNELSSRLPPDFLRALPDGVEISYAAIPAIRGLQEPLRRQVQDAFAGALDVLWQVMIGLAGLGLLSALLMRELGMGTAVDERFGLEGRAQNADEEARSPGLDEKPGTSSA